MSHTGIFRFRNFSWWGAGETKPNKIGKREGWRGRGQNMYGFGSRRRKVFLYFLFCWSIKV